MLIKIDTILKEFLEEQRLRLKPRTYRDYEEVIFFFKEYLNQYAYQYLDSDERKKWESEFEDDINCFTRLFGQNKLTSTVTKEFLDYFIIRKVMSSEEFVKKSVRVMNKFSKWLTEKNYTQDANQDYFKEAKDLPKVEKLANLIYDHARKYPDKEYEEVLEGYFSVSNIKEGVFWLDEELGDRINIGPVLVTKQISDLCQLNWKINLVIGRDKNGWHILESGNVYRD